MCQNVFNDSIVHITSFYSDESKFCQFFCDRIVAMADNITGMAGTCARLYTVHTSWLISVSVGDITLIFK